MSERDLFVAALAIADPAERSDWLDRACCSDAALRQRIGVLLRALDKTGSPLDNPVVAPHVTNGATGPGEAAVHEPSSAGAGPEPGLEEPGTVIGRYKLLESIGEGGMGSVWMARQTEPVKRLVAVKLIKPGMDSKQVLARFEAERQALALMDHPNIAKVHDAGTTPDGRPFFVMELVKGVPIARFCDENHLTLRQRLELFVPVCHAIQHAHQKGVIHRDLKPSNVLVALYDDKPVPKVIDFGVAKATGQQLTEQSLHTGFGSVVGTFEYMSPEQASFNNLDVDTRADIYSLGVLLYELLTGSPPFSRKELKKAGVLEMLRIIREQEPSKPSTKLSTAEGLPTLAANRGTEPKRLTALVRGELDWIVMKALEKDRNRRYETANGFAQDVRHYLADEPVLACPPSLSYRLRKFVRRNKAALTAAGLVALALVAGVLTSTWQAFRATKAEALARERLGAEEEARRDVDDARHQAEADRDRASRAEHRAQHQLYKAKLAQAKADRGNEKLGQRAESLTALAEAAGLIPALHLDAAAVLDLRNEVIGALTLTDLRRDRHWEGLPEGTAVAFDARLERYAREGGRGTVSVRQIDGDRELVRLPALEETGPAVSSLGFSPDGRFLAAVYASSQAADNARPLRVWELTSRRAVLAAPSAQGDPAFSPDGRQVAFGHSDGSIRLHDLLSGQEQKRLSPELPPSLLQFHPGGGRLAVADPANKAVHLVSLATGQVTSRLAHENGVTALAWHPGGRVLATADPGTLTLWETEAAPQKLVAWTGSALAQIPRLAFSHSGDMLAAPGRLFDPWVGEFLVDLSASGGIWPQFSPDDGQLAYQQGSRLGVLRLADRREWRPLRRSRGPVSGLRGVDVNPDGRLLVSVGSDGAQFWDLVRGVDIPSLRIPGAAAAVFDQANGAVLISGPDGVQRWPVVRADGPEPGGLRVGPPQTILPAKSQLGPIALSPDGRSLVVKVADGEAAALHADHPGQPVRLQGDSGLGLVAVSPDGRWAAAAPGYPKPVNVWDARSGRLVCRLPDTESRVPARLAFSPDGRWLVTATVKEFRFWQVGTWESGLRVAKDELGNAPGQLAFSRDGTLLAVQHSWSLVKLMDPRTGAELASLTITNLGIPASALCFSADGSELLVGDARNQIHVWDLRLTRARLAEMQLDWGLPPYALDTRAGQGPLQGRVVMDATEIRSLEGHSNSVWSVAYSPDGRYGLSGSGDGTARLWELETGREIRRFLGHTVSFSPDGQRILSGSEDATVRLWDVETGKELRQFKGHVGKVWGVTFSADGRRALSCAVDATLRLWDVESGQELRRFTGHTAGMWCIALSPDGRYAISGSHSSMDGVRVWDVETGKETLRLQGHTSFIRCVVFSPDGRYALSGSADKTVRLWDVKTGQELRRFNGHQREVNSVAFSPDGRYALSGSADKTVRLWDVETGVELRQWQAHFASVAGVAFSRDGRRALSAGLDHVVRLWDLTPREAGGPDLPKYVEAVARDPRDAAAHHQFAWALATGRDPRHRNAQRAVELAQRAVDLVPEEGRFWTALGVARYRAGNWQTAVQALDRSAQLRKEADATSLLFLAMAHWRLGHDEQARRAHLRAIYWVEKEAADEELGRFRAEAAAMLPSACEMRRLEGHTELVVGVAYSPDGRRAASASYDGTLRLWDLATGREIRRFEGHAGQVLSVAYSPDGRRLLSGGQDNSVRLWDVETGKELRQFKGHVNCVWGVIFSSDGRRALSCAGDPDKTLRLWDVESGQELRRFTGHTAGIWSTALSPDGRHAISGPNDPVDGVRVWDVETGKETVRLQGHTEAVRCVVFSPDGRYALSGSYDHTARLWDVKTGKELRRFEGHSGGVLCVAFSPDGRRALSASWDGTVRLWNVETGKETWRFTWHLLQINSVTFSPDGRQALTGSWDKTLRLLELPAPEAKGPSSTP